MMLIPCPYCGPRAHVEFTYDRPLEGVLPVSADEALAVRTLYERSNPRGPHVELWRHTHGCRAWLKVERDTSTHAVQSVEPFTS